MTSISAHIKSLQGPIWVVGASGFVGSNLYHLLSQHRSDVYALIHSRKTYRLKSVPDNKRISLDLLDAVAVLQVVGLYRPRTIFSLFSYGAYSFQKEASKILSTNLIGLSNLVEALSTCPISAFVHAGSSSEYGLNSQAPHELAHVVPNSVYSVSKYAASSYLSFLSRSAGLPAINLRLYSLYGPLEDTSRLVPQLLINALHHDTYPPLVSANITHDFVYVEDACNAFVLAASKMNPEIAGNSYNIGTGVKTSICDIANLVGETFGVSDSPVFGTMEERSWDLLDWYANPTAAKDDLGWEATTSLTVGLKKTAAWIRSSDSSKLTALTKNNTVVHESPSLSAVVACYKDAEAIPEMYERLTNVFQENSIEYEIIFVNDCSPDSTQSILDQLTAQDSSVISITHSRNFGSQMAFRSGMEIASKDGVVLLDGDLQDPPEMIKSFYDEWQNGYDVVYGVRSRREMPYYRELMYKLFYIIFSRLSYVSIPLHAGDFSLIDRKVVSWILKSPERDLFLRGLRAYLGFNQLGIKYVRPERKYGRSTNSFFKNLSWAKMGILSYSNKPLSFMFGLGLLLSAGSLLLGLYVGIGKILSLSLAPPGVTLILVVCLLFGSFNLLFVGLVGEYVGKILVEVKRRPRYIVSRKGFRHD